MSASRLDQALLLLLQAPPGQTSQVYHDLRGILLDPEANANDGIDEAALQAAAGRALEEYNTQQLITTTLASDGVAKAEGGGVIICQAGQLVQAAASLPAGTKRYAHPKAKKSFLYDHIKRTVSGIEPLQTANAEAEKTRAALEAALQDYVADRYVDGVSSVFTVSDVPLEQTAADSDAVTKAAQDDASHPAENTASVGATGEEQEAAPTGEDADMQIKENPVEAVADAEAVAADAEKATSAPEPAEDTPVKYAIHHVGNRYNLSNFWSGRWRASYVLDPQANTLTSSLTVQVHYFENGNVQLNASKPRVFALPASSDPTSLAKSIAKLVSSYEDAYQHALEQTYDELAEKAFKALRRQLPLTRQKVDWDKVLNYRIGEQLAKTT